MNKNVLIVLAGGFVIAILVAVLVQASLKGKSTASEEKKVEILVATKPLKIGSEITEKDAKWQEWPETMLFDGAIVRKDKELAQEAVTGRLTERVAAGQPIHKKMTVDTEKGDMLAATLRAGYRAVGIRVPIETIAGGLIGPGDYVDVIMTYTIKKTGNSTIARKYATETILENIRVLGIDTKSVAEDQGEEGKKKKSKSNLTVTIEVTPVGAEKIALAEEAGEVKLALRSLGDNALIEGDRATTDVGVSKVLRTMVDERFGDRQSIKIYNGASMEYAVGSAGSVNDQIGRDADEDGLGLDETYEDENFVPPGDMVDAVREGIADGIARGIRGEE